MPAAAGDEDEDDNDLLQACEGEELLGVEDAAALDLLPDLADGLDEEVGLDDAVLGADPEEVASGLDLTEDGGDLPPGDAFVLQADGLDDAFDLREESALGDDALPLKAEWDDGFDLDETDTADEDGGSEGVDDFGLEAIDLERAPLTSDDDTREGVDDLERDILSELGL